MSNHTIGRASKNKRSSSPRETSTVNSVTVNVESATSNNPNFLSESTTKSTKSCDSSVPQIRHSKTSGGSPFVTMVSFSTVLEFFQLSNFENALSLDEIIFLRGIWLKLHPHGGVSYVHENPAQNGNFSELHECSSGHLDGAEAGDSGARETGKRRAED